MPKYIDNLLAETLIELSRDRNLDSITVMDLVSAAGVNRKTFYNHFDGIAGLLQYLIQKLEDELIADRDDPENWGDSIRNIMEYMQEYAWFVSKVLRSKYLPELKTWLIPKLEESMKEYINVGVQLLEQNTGNPYSLTDSQLQLLARVYAPCVYYLIEDWFLNGMKEPIDEYMNVILRVLTGGVFAAIDYLVENGQSEEV
ncbi:MAG: TetR/AcrR family transcriptional regulator C-terminal domain-containing protein [Oscillospiraceae bacterium]|nr:TetR/AcrR family transcriptional regulator C-terminal domain-containing protein [Oscillospiraceae bacterium]